MVPSTQTEPTQKQTSDLSEGPAQGITSQTKQRGAQGQQMQRAGPSDTGLAPLVMFALDPLSIMQQMGDNMSRLLEGFGMRRAISPASRLTFTPHVEVSEHNNEVVVYVDLPGVPEENIQIEVMHGALVIEGERQRREEKPEQGVLRTERVYEVFRRVIQLPAAVDPETATATCTDGVLEIRFPVQQQQYQRINITPRKAENNSGSAVKEQDH